MWRHRSGRRRRRRFDVAGRRRRARLLRRAAAFAVVAAAVAVVAALGLSDVLRARTQLSAARSALQAAVDDPAALGTPEGRVAALAQVDGAVASIAQARRRVAGSRALSLAGFVPGLRGQRTGFIDLIDDAATAAGAGRELLAAVDGLAGQTQLRDGAVPLEGLALLQQEVRKAGDTIAGRSEESTRLYGPLGEARRQFDDVAASTSRRLSKGAEALGTARTFLGAGGPRRYLVAAQNNAEMRDQGAVLSYVVLSLDRGRVSRERQGSVADLTLTAPARTPVPAGTQEVFGPIAPTQTWQSVNATADFAFSGRAMADMYRQATGESVDGVIALDVPALAGLLRIVGPVSIDGVIEPVTGDNVGRLLLHDFYQGLGPSSDQTIRRERQGDVVRAVLERVTAGSYDAVTLGRMLGDAAAGGHLRLWSGEAGEEDVFERTGLGGGPATVDPDRTFHLAVQNRTASKLDYFVKPSVSQEVVLTQKATAVVRTTVVIDNQAPQNGTASYQLGPAMFTERPGDYLAWVLLWGPAGSRQVQGGTAESGMNLSQYVVAVPAGERREVVFETVVPQPVRNGMLQIRLVPQPRLEPMPLTVTLKVEGRTASPVTLLDGPWDRIRNLTWVARG